MPDNDENRQRWLTARREAGHAVAALHYDCPFDHVSIEAAGHTLGATRLAAPELPEDAIVLFCGPLAEMAWEEFRPGHNVIVHAVGTDLEGLHLLQEIYGDLNDRYLESLIFLSNPLIQQQVDRVASALLERTRLSTAEARETAGFCEPIRHDAPRPKP